MRSLINHSEGGSMEEILVTDGGKEISIRPAINNTLVEICFTTGGELPESLQGYFTSYAEAKKAALVYIANKSSNGTRKTKQGV